MRLRLCVFFLSWIFCTVANAHMILQAEVSYSNDGLSPTSAASDLNSSYFVQIYFQVTKRFYAGWGYTTINQSQSGASTASLVSTDMGPCIRLNFGRGDLFTFQATYNITSLGTYVAGTTNNALTGTSTTVSLGVMPEVSEGLRLGVDFVSYTATYTKSTAASTHIETTVGNTKTMIMPLLVLSKEW